MGIIDAIKKRFLAQPTPAAVPVSERVPAPRITTKRETTTPTTSPQVHEATVEELMGVGKNRRFDAVVDDEYDEEIKVICRRGDEEISLAKPSRAFYFGDRQLYDQEAKRYDQGEKARVLCTDQYHSNLQTFDDLKRACNRGFVIPFVGAGMSRSAGLPDWRGYLLRLAEDAGMDVASVRHRLDVPNDYEGVIDDIIDRMGHEKFERDFERDFALPDEVTGPVTLLPAIFDGPSITTNFDRVLESVYEQQGKPFVEKVCGRGRPNAFFRSIPAGERYLFKLHGNVDNASERVLRRSEYEEAYGQEGNILFDRALPKALSRLFSSYSFLFLGCSLTVDRTIQTFMRVAGEQDMDGLPHHYAVMSCPSDGEERLAVDRRLAGAHISPIWFPEDEYEYIEEILQLLLD